MSHHSRSSDPVDPLLDYTLFNAKLSSSDPSKPFDFDRDLQVIINHLKSTVPLDGLKDQARNILSGTSGVKKSGMSRALERLKEHVPANSVEDNRERRPGLGRKRAHFSMKPNSSQPEKSLKPTFESKKFKDPVEYFKAYERHENATREMEKLSGTVMDADQQNLSLITRTRRPGLSRKPVKYKHLYSPAENKIYEDTISSQEVFETTPPNSVKPSSQTESHADLASEMDLGGSKVNEDNKTNDALHNLLSQDTEVLENDGAKHLLEEYLHLKTFEVEDICLPDFSDTWKVDLKSSRRPLLKPGSVKSRHAAEGSIHLASLTPPKSPLASLALLSKRRSLQSSSIELQSSSSDPFSACHIDQLPVKNPSSVENRNKNCNLVDMLEKSKFSVELEAPSNKQNDKTEGAKAGSLEVVIEEYTQVLELSKSDSLSKVFVGSNVDMEEENRGSTVVKEALRKPYDSNTEADGVSIGDKVEHKLQGALPETNATESTLEELNSAESQVADDDIVNDERQEEKRQETMPEHNVIDAHLEKLNIAQSQPVDIVMNCDEVQDQDKQQQPVPSAEHGLNVADSSVERLHNPLSQLDQLHSVPLEENPSNGLSNPVTGPEKQNEIMQEHSGVSLNKPIEADPHSRKKQKRKVLSKRQSLAAHGTSWKSGVRRSTRIKTRPLEFWKGERLLYGRVHDSLPTVIGMKYASPGKGEQRALLKVKSFVSDKHKLLVDLVSLH